MGDPTAFTDPENWAGGFYELTLEIGDRDDDRLQRAVTTLWQAASIAGSYASTHQEPADQVTVPTTVTALHEVGHLRGLVRLPGGRSIVCGCLAGRCDNEPDWLTFYLPLGALARVDRRVGGFPFGPDGGRQSLIWRAPLDAWLAKIAGEIFRGVEFQLGLIGFETHADVTAAGLNGAVPERRWEAYLLPTGGQLRYVPANQ